MNVATAEIQGYVLSDRLRHRLASLGVTVLRLSPDRPAEVEGDMRWIEQLISQSPIFTALVHQHWPTLMSATGQAVSLWPGVSVVPLPVRQRRRAPLAREQQLLAALILGPELVHSEQLRAVCDHRRLDFQATVSRIDLQMLFGAQEADRLAQTLVWMYEDGGENDRRTAELHSLSGELAESYEELSLLYKLSSSMTVYQPPTRFLSEACRELQQVVELRWMALQLADESRLEDLAHRVFTAGDAGSDPAPLHEMGRELLARFSHLSEPVIVDDTSILASPAISKLARNLLVVPLRAEHRLLGMLFGADKLDATHINSIDAKLCNSMANSFSIFLENRMLYDDMQSMFLGTLHALTSAIDAKDSYTHGHSERVALMSQMLAEAAGLDAMQCERIYIAGLVHDVGKIGVPEAVLCKPGALTDDEFRLIKMHPEIGGRILQDIRQMQDLIPGVLHHHERWDGRGYPARLAGADIPIFGRVIGLADAFDAMSSDRTYRRAMKLEHVLQEVRRCSGTQFDPKLVEHFVKLDFTPYAQLIERHHREQTETAA